MWKFSTRTFRYVIFVSHNFNFASLITSLETFIIVKSDHNLDGDDSEFYGQIIAIHGWNWSWRFHFIAYLVDKSTKSNSVGEGIGWNLNQGFHSIACLVAGCIEFSSTRILQDVFVFVSWNRNLKFHSIASFFNCQRCLKD